LIFSIFGGYWAFFEPKFWEEVGDEQPTSNLYKPSLIEAMEDSQGQKKESYAEEKPSQSHFVAGKILRSRRCWVIYESSRRLFCVSFSLQGSRDLDEHDQIIRVANWHCCDVFLIF